MLEEDIRQLRAILGRVVTTGSDTPQTRPYLNHAYAGLMEALTALEQLHGTTLLLPTTAAQTDVCELAHFACLQSPSSQSASH
ncbi:MULTISPECIES: hypothetical protein [unclassified Leptolyngbya]|uniref:hypothetical protein n=1 Tax=unclassified Leptolyngbya TaxID=2650499 RepID=UPI00168817F4|nr:MULTISPECIES: hypothetical protein [unclassified Leptolyngbya]MBD1911533.1 hypothetical protein [Leptolyngbya sp. FACHB-8]MBD2155567.1 hypothetical protein [Leptolyngbya sp. FACHB-16]